MDVRIVVTNAAGETFEVEMEQEGFVRKGANGSVISFPSAVPLIGRAHCAIVAAVQSSEAWANSE